MSNIKKVLLGSNKGGRLLFESSRSFRDIYQWRKRQYWWEKCVKLSENGSVDLDLVTGNGDEDLYS